MYQKTKNSSSELFRNDLPQDPDQHIRNITEPYRSPLHQGYTPPKAILKNPNYPSPSTFAANSPHVNFPLSAPPQICIFHTNQFITNFCKNERCLLPLCPQCIIYHLELHKGKGQHANVITIEKALEDCHSIVDELEKKYKANIHRINAFKTQRTDLGGYIDERIKLAQEKVLHIVESFFYQLQREAFGLTSHNQSNLDNELIMAEKFAIQKKTELDTIKKKLSGDKYLKHVVRLHSSTYFNQSDYSNRECEQFVNILSKQFLDIQPNDSCLYTFNIQLAKYVQLKNAEFFQEEQKNPVAMFYEQRNPYFINQSKSLGDGAIGNPVEPPVTRSPLEQIQRNSPYGQGDPMNNLPLDTFKKHQFNRSNASHSFGPNSETLQRDFIKQKDYYDKQCPKFLYYFKSGTHIFNYINLDIINPPVVEWKSIILKITFQLPQESATVITPIGEIYLTGGADKQNKFLFNTTFKLDLQKKTLNKRPEMLTARRLHQMVYLNNYLYVLGGEDSKNQKIDLCECYDISLSKGWERIAPMNHKASAFAVCAYKKKLIFVFGKDAQSKNFVEYYDPQFNQWLDIVLRMNIEIEKFNILSFSNAVQINENTIILFGGEKTSSRGEENCYKFQINEGVQVDAMVSFWEKSSVLIGYRAECQAIVYQNLIYTSILSPLENDLSQRKICIFNGSEALQFG